MNLEPIELLSFDCYGTLIDWESGILNALRTFRDENSMDASDDDILVQYGRIESTIQAGAYQPYKDILRDVMRGLAEHYRIKSGNYDEGALVNSVQNWVPFSDAVDALRLLGSRYKLAIISNIDDDLFAHSARHLQVPFDHIVTAQQVGAYKPSHKNFVFAEETFGMSKGSWLHVAQSLFHDIAPAKDLGVMSAWINRRHDRDGDGATPSTNARPEMEFPDLISFARKMMLS